MPTYLIKNVLKTLDPSSAEYADLAAYLQEQIAEEAAAQARGSEEAVCEPLYWATCVAGEDLFGGPDEDDD